MFVLTKYFRIFKSLVLTLNCWNYSCFTTVCNLDSEIPMYFARYLNVVRRWLNTSNTKHLLIISCWNINQSSSIPISWNSQILDSVPSWLVWRRKAKTTSRPRFSQSPDERDRRRNSGLVRESFARREARSSSAYGCVDAAIYATGDSGYVLT